MYYCRASRTLGSCNEMVSSDTHTFSSKGIAHQTGGFHERPGFEELAILHVFLTMANTCFRKYPQTCRKSGSHRIFPLPSTDSAPHCDGIRELGFRLDGNLKIELVRNKGMPRLSHDIFSCELGPFYSVPHFVRSNQSFRQKRFSVLPFPLYERGILYVCPPITGPRSKMQTHHQIVEPNLGRQDSCRRGPDTDDDDQGADAVSNGCMISR